MRDLINKFFKKEKKINQFFSEFQKLRQNTDVEKIFKSISVFRAKGAASLLMDVNTGEILSLISLPDYNLNTRKDIKDKSFTNKITKGVFELGSIFKTFTIALALEDNLFSPNTLVKNIPDKIQCSKFTIKEHDEMPNTLSLKEILIIRLKK